MLLRDKKGVYILACLPGDQQLDLKKVQGVAECKRLSFASPEQIEEVLGYRKGAIAPISLKQQPLTIFDKKLQEKFKVNISSGDHRAGLELNRKELIELIKPMIANIIKE